MNDTTTTFTDPFAGLLDSPLTGAPVEEGYRARIDRQRPSCLLFLVDQSASMDESFQGQRMKAVELADTVNSSIFNLVSRCTFSDGCRRYFDVGVVGYSGDGLSNALTGPLSGDVLRPLPDFESHPVRIEHRPAGPDDTDSRIPFPVWLEPRMAGGTPMCAALRKARDILAPWCDAHPQSYPPTVIHVTDGQSTDGNPEPAADELRSLRTNDGSVMLFNLHIASGRNVPVMFPDADGVLPDSNARMLFRMSSVIPTGLRAAVAERGFPVSDRSRFFGYNGDPTSLVKFLQIGTLAAQQA